MSTKIKSISFGKEETILGFVESYQPKDGSDIANEKTPATHYDLPRHGDFERSLDKMKPHLAIASGFAEPLDNIGNVLTEQDFNDFFADDDAAAQAFKGLTITGIIIQGKHAADGVQLLGTKENANGDVMKLKTAPIALKRVPDGYNYPLLDILDNQVDLLLVEAEKYRTRKKHGAGVQKEMNLVA